jgi:EpsD family peptidyl-prolyl cis-trans isomerase
VLGAGAVLVTLVLTACGGRGGVPESQVAARVNEDEITVHQVQVLLQRQPRLAQEFPEQAARQALEVLVEQQLAVQAARAQGIDKEPSVVQAIEAARREVIARAYQDRIAAKATEPSSDEIDAYYVAHPGLFSKRRLYTMNEFVVPTAGAAQVERVQAAAAAKSAAEIEAQLTQAGLRHGSRLLTQAPEDMPLALVEKMAGLEVGRALVVPQGELTRVFFLLHAQPAPVERRAANEAIAGFLSSERKRRAVAENMKAVRDKAKIEFLGSFARTASAPAPAPAPATAPAR